jgi:hypothetical protein
MLHTRLGCIVQITYARGPIQTSLAHVTPIMAQDTVFGIQNFLVKAAPGESPERQKGGGWDKYSG